MIRLTAFTPPYFVFPVGRIKTASPTPRRASLGFLGAWRAFAEARLDNGRMRADLARQDTVEASWRAVDGILGGAVPLHSYARGTWGPKEADGLLPDGVPWHDPAG